MQRILRLLMLPSGLHVWRVLSRHSNRLMPWQLAELLSLKKMMWSLSPCQAVETRIWPLTLNIWKRTNFETSVNASTTIKYEPHRYTLSDKKEGYSFNIFYCRISVAQFYDRNN